MIHVDKEKLINNSSGVVLDNDITESAMYMANVRKSRMEYFRRKRLISKEMPFHALIKKNSYKPFGHVMQKT